MMMMMMLERKDQNITNQPNSHEDRSSLHKFKARNDCRDQIDDEDCDDNNDSDGDGDGDGDGEGLIDYIQLFQENSSIFFHNQPEKYRDCYQILYQYYQKNYQANQRRSHPPPSQQSSTTASLSSLQLNAIIVGSAVNIRDNRPVSKEVDLSSQLLASRLLCLHCMNCNLKEISSFFQLVALPKLTHLNLSFNLLRDFPLSADTLRCSQQLVILDLSHNKLTSIDAIGALQQLRILRLHSNQIESLPGLQTCLCLEELWISNNRIDWLQLIYLYKLEKLKILMKQGNPCDQKIKCNEFLQAVIPSLQVIDMERLENNKDKEEFCDLYNGNNNGNSTMNNNDLKVSVDVRVMITQAKAFLKKDQESRDELEKEKEKERDKDREREKEKAEKQNKSNRRRSLSAAEEREREREKDKEKEKEKDH